MKTDIPIMGTNISVAKFFLPVLRVNRRFLFILLLEFFLGSLICPGVKGFICFFFLKIMLLKYKLLLCFDIVVWYNLLCNQIKIKYG
jgi:hypothetical protein